MQDQSSFYGIRRQQYLQTKGLTLAEKLRMINRRALNKKFNILDDRKKAYMQLAKIRWGTNLPISRPKLGADALLIAVIFVLNI
jgi:hypothetical protein